MLYLYNEENIIIQQEELEKNNKSNIQLNINENGIYKVEIIAYYKEDINTVSDFYLEKELFVENIEVSKFNNELLNENEQISMASIDYEQESMVRMSISENEENNEASYRQVNINLASVEGESQITGLDNKEQTQDVKITGNIMDDKGNMPVANFKVTVPTSASFTVNKSVGFIGPDLEVKNEGAQEIEVYAQNFSRTEGGTGTINIVPQSELAIPANKSRAYVALRLEGEDGNKAYLGVGGNGTGVYAAGHEDLVTSEPEGVKLLTLSAGDKKAQTGTISLKGLAGTGEVNEAISNNFQLTLRIKKVMNQPG